MGQYMTTMHEEGQQQHLSEAALQAWGAQLLQAKPLSVQRLTEYSEECKENKQLTEAREIHQTIARHQADEKQEYHNVIMQKDLQYSLLAETLKNTEERMQVLRDQEIGAPKTIPQSVFTLKGS